MRERVSNMMKDDRMGRATRVMAMITLLVVVAGCDKCGDLNINMPGAAKVCTDTKPRG